MSPARTGFRAVLSAVFLCTLFLASDPARADEGMWTIHDFPSGAVAERYGASIGPEWLARVQRATVRLDGGCTGSFSSANGLVLTNNHCVWGCIRNLSTDEENLSETGFLATNPGEELLPLRKIASSGEIARVMLAEQIYRAVTILVNHPYHRE